MAKRSYNRRTDEEIIDDLQDKIKKIESRLQARQRKDSPVLKEIPRVKKVLGRFAQMCVDHERGDLSNTALAFLATLERQARQVPAHVAPAPAHVAPAHVAPAHVAPAHVANGEARHVANGEARERERKRETEEAI